MRHDTNSSIKLAATRRFALSTIGGSGDPVLADYEHRAPVPHCCGGSLVRRLETTSKVAIGLTL